jgi:hypothetical protein
MPDPHSPEQPLEFRREEVGYVMERWRASDSCSLVGIGSVGKSNLLRHLGQSDVQAYYISATQAEHFKAIIVDPSLLGPLPTAGDDLDQVRCWAAYELLMHRIFLAFYPFDSLTKDEANEIYEIYQALQDGSNPLYAYMGLRYFELGLDFFMRRGFQIVFMFDEFEEMLRQMPVKFFQTLRGLRDNYKRQLSYLTFTRAPLPVLVDRMNISRLDIEPFVELFTDSLLYVGPYNDADARRMADGLVRRNQRNYDEPTINFLLWSSGRYAGLLRSTFRLLETLGPISMAEQKSDRLLNALAVKTPIRQECRTIWTSLTPAEQYVLKAVARLSEYSVNTETEQAVTQLVQKRLLRVTKSQKLDIEPPVFRAFVATNPDIDM